MRNTINIIFAFLFCVSTFAYTTYPSCPNFTDIKASYVVATTGDVRNPFVTEGVDSTRQKLISTQGTDPRTGGALSLLPTGESQVVRLGNEQVGAQAESLTYHFIVDNDNPILFVKFAVVLEDPQHNQIEQPRFVMRIMDKNGKLIEDCAEYDIYSGGDIEGFQRYGGVQWRDWTNVGLDMSKFAGQEVLVQFVTYDCTQSGHYGYAYFTAQCIPNRLHFSSCKSANFTVEAPAGFVSYLWDNGDQSQSSTRTKTGNSMTLNCTVTSATGCAFTLSALVSDESGLPNKDTVIIDTICQGEPYAKYRYNLPAQMETGTHTFYNSILSPTSCGGDVNLTLQLTVIPRYTVIKKSICQGMNYTENGFNIQQPPVGNLRDSLFLKSKNALCDSIICLDLTVNASFSLPIANAIKGDANPCVGEAVSYSFEYAGESASFVWTVPDSTVIVSGQGTSQISLIFEDTKAGNIILTGKNGCGSGAVSIAVHPKPSYHSFVADSICTGDSYNKNGFDLGVQDSTGYFVVTHNYQTQLGCDSVKTLALSVFPTPSLQISSQGNDVLCGSKAITLHALANGASFSPNIPRIVAGDILCTDGSTIKPADYASSGKVAEGVVFYVDKTGEHGWAVGLTEANVKWSTESRDITTLTNYYPISDALLDIDGYTNTQKIRAVGDATFYPAVWAVDFANGWYLPAAGQLAFLVASRYLILNSSLAVVGGIMMDRGYWSSTEFDIYNSFTIDTGDMYQYSKGQRRIVRAIKNF